MALLTFIERLRLVTPSTTKGNAKIIVNGKTTDVNKRHIAVIMHAVQVGSKMPTKRMDQVMQNAARRISARVRTVMAPLEQIA